MTGTHPQQITAPELQAWLASDRPQPLLVDVREDQELALARLPHDVLHLPLSRSNTWLSSLPEQLHAEQPVVVLCHAGVRSHHFGLWLLEQPWGLEVWNLDGGIDAWSAQVDSSVPRY
ncbi:MAG: rhodanese-like domain-containing protein [Synechococcus sp.]